jgi:hypothetical protein
MLNPAPWAQLVGNEGAELGVDGGGDLGESFELGDGDASGGEGFRHLEADVAGANDDRRGDVASLEGAEAVEGVAHRAEEVDAGVRGCASR